MTPGMGPWDNTVMSLPDHIAIGGTTYLVSRLLEDQEEMHGEFSAAHQTIRLADKVGADYLKYLLAHEIVHGMFEHAGANTGKAGERFTEEQIACIIGRTLPALLKDNPDLVAYLTE